MNPLRAAFTLLELLTVMCIMALVLAIGIPALKTLSESSNLTQSASLISSNIQLARQTALSSNRIVEIRFYRLKDEVGASPAFRAMQIFSYDEPRRGSDGEYLYVDTGAGNVSLPPATLSNLIKLPSGIIIDSDSKYSTLINTTTNRDLKKATVPGYDDLIDYQYFRFQPTGGTDLNPNGTNSDQWFLTLHSEHAPAAADRPTANFVTIMIDPVSGQTQTFRP